MFTSTEYLQFAAYSLGYSFLFLSPIVFAALVATIPSKLNKRMRFALTCGALSYGTAMLVEAVVTPLQMVATYLAPSWQDAGYTTGPDFFFAVAEYTWVLSVIAGIVVAIWLPFYMRKNVWPILYSA